jgi:hypothetical protein
MMGKWEQAQGSTKFDGMTTEVGIGVSVNPKRYAG